MIGYDPSGCFVISSLIIGLAYTTIVCGTVSAVSNVITALGTGQDIGAAFVGGFINGAINGFGVSVGLALGGIPGLLAAGFLGFAGGYLGSVVETRIGTGEWDWKDEMHFAKGGLSGAVNMITYGYTKFIMNDLGEQLTGSFMDRLTQALAPSEISFMINGVYGGIIGMGVGVAGIIAHYISGGKYEREIEKYRSAQICYMA